jgi:hypothetical protein
MAERIPAKDFPNSEILDIDIDPNSANVAVTTPSKLRILDLKNGKIEWAIDEIKISNRLCSIRCCKFRTINLDSENQLAMDIYM